MYLTQKQKQDFNEKRVKLINEYSAELRKNNATVLVGAGLSYACGLPSWEKLLEECLTGEFDPTKTNDEIDYYKAAEKFCRDKGRPALNELLERKISKRSRDYKLTDSHKIISRWPISEIWTTNFDMAIENAFDLRGKKIKILNSDEDITQRLDRDDLKVFKIHGCITKPNGIVITHSDVVNYSKNYFTMQNSLYTTLASKTFLFIGFGFRDSRMAQSLTSIFARYPYTGRKHYALLVNDERDEKAMKRLQNELAYYNIESVILPDATYVPIILKDIEKNVIRQNVYLSGAVSKISDIDGSFSLFNYKQTLAEVDNSRDDVFDYNVSALNQQFGVGKINDFSKKLNEEVFFNSSSQIGTAPIEDFCFKLGQTLIENGKHVYSGGGELISKYVAEGTISKLNESEFNHQDENSIIHLRTFRSGKMKIGDGVTQDSIRNFIRNCGFMISIKGRLYNSDFHSGAFEDYQLMRGMASVLHGWQIELGHDITNLLKRQKGSKQHQSIHFKDSKNHIEKIYDRRKEDDRITAPNSLTFLKQEIESIQKHQAEIVYHKYNEIIGIFTTRFQKQWKLVCKTIEAKRIKLLVEIHYNDDEKLPKELNDSLTLLCENLHELILKTTDLHCIQYRSPSIQTHKEPNDKLEQSLILAIKNAHNQLFIGFSKFHTPNNKEEKDLNEQNFKALKRKLKYIEEILHLVKANQKYTELHEWTHDFAKIENEYTYNYLFKIIKKSDRQVEGDVESFNSCATLFKEYEDKIIAKLKQCIKLCQIRDNNNLKDNFESYINRLKIKEGEYLLLKLQDTFGNEIVEEIKKNDTVATKYCRIYLRLFLIQYEMGAESLRLNNTIDNKINISQEQKNQIKATKIKFKNDKTSFYKSLVDIIGDSIDSDKIHSRSYLLIYRIQLYKLFNWLADMDEGLQRIKSDFETSKVRNIRRRYENYSKSVLWNLRFHGINDSDGKFDTSETNFSPPFENHLHPYVLDPNTLEEEINKVEQYKTYYDKHVVIHQSMVNIKRTLDSFLENFPVGTDENMNWEELNSPIISSAHKLIFGEIEKIKNATNGDKKIESEKSGFYNTRLESYRSATIILPIGCYGGVAKKLWTSERFRFEMFVSGLKRYEHEASSEEGKSIARNNAKLLFAFYQLQYPNGLGIRHLANQDEANILNLNQHEINIAKTTEKYKNINGHIVFHIETILNEFSEMKA